MSNAFGGGDYADATPTPLLLATGDRCLWAVISDNLSRGSRLICYDPTDRKVVHSRNLSFVPTDLVLIRGEVWLGLSGVRPKLIELDAQTLRIRRRVPLVP